MVILVLLPTQNHDVSFIQSDICYELNQVNFLLI